MVAPGRAQRHFGAVLSRSRCRGRGRRLTASGSPVLRRTEWGVPVLLFSGPVRFVSAALFPAALFPVALFPVALSSVPLSATDSGPSRSALRRPTPLARAFCRPLPAGPTTLRPPGLADPPRSRQARPTPTSDKSDLYGSISLAPEVAGGGSAGRSANLRAASD